MKLYGYYRSSAAYRVRIALSLKNLTYEYLPVHLLRGGGEQFDPSYLRLNPQAQMPAFADGSAVIIQSMAIIEYLEETHPLPALLPEDPAGRARVRALAQVIACDIHPLNNLRVTGFLTNELGHSEQDKLRWYRHWVREGLKAFEALIRDHPETGIYCHGDQPTIADVFLIPQLYNARRFECDIADCPTVGRIDVACGELAAFRAAAPESQPDAA